MQSWVERVGRLHRYLADHAVYPSVQASGLAVGLLSGRMVRSHSFTFVFLLWNRISGSR